ncbi:hypothetical protein BH11MYX2_BH11MYX2_05530 [soil metagenome]
MSLRRENPARGVKAIGFVLIAALAACTGDVDEQWFLDHDRIIAVRASSPGIVTGETSTLDALVGFKGAPPAEMSPPLAMVVSPESLASTLSMTAGEWTVTAPDEAALAAARTELNLEAGAPVPLQVGVAFLATAFPARTSTDPVAALKTVWLGEHRDNPMITGIDIDGVDGATLTDVVLDYTMDTPMRIDASVNDGDDVNWLTSCGTEHDFDLEHSYIRIEKDDPVEGDLAVVLRKPNGGVAWKTWTIHVDPATIPPAPAK